MNWETFIFQPFFKFLIRNIELQLFLDSRNEKANKNNEYQFQ